MLLRNIPIALISNDVTQDTEGSSVTNFMISLL